MRHHHRLPLAALLLVLFACATTPTPETPTAAQSTAPPDSADPSADAAPESAAPSPTPHTTCYLGPTTQTAPDGTERPGAELLVRRTVDRDASTITEETVRFDPQVATPRRYTVVYAVSGDSFQLEEAGGAFAGSGTFTAGEPWAWTAWESSYRLPSGISVTSTRGLGTGADGRALLTAERVAFGPDGGKALTLHEELSAIDEGECERRFAELPADG